MDNTWRNSRFILIQIILNTKKITFIKQKKYVPYIFGPVEIFNILNFDFVKNSLDQMLCGHYKVNEELELFIYISIVGNVYIYRNIVVNEELAKK